MPEPLTAFWQNGGDSAKMILNFGKSRNRYMVQKILDIASAYKGQRIIVLTGLIHKYFLIDELNKQTKINLKLLDLK